MTTPAKRLRCILERVASECESRALDDDKDRAHVVNAMGKGVAEWLTSEPVLHLLFGKVAP